MIDLIKQYAPAILALMIAYYRDKTIEARNKQRMAELEKKLLENQDAIEKANAGKSSDDIIDGYTKGPTA